MPHSASASCDVPSASIPQNPRYSSVRTVFPLRADAVQTQPSLWEWYAIQGKTKTSHNKVVAMNNAHTIC